MTIFTTKNTKLAGIICGLSILLNTAQAAELVQFSNGSIADANDVNANFNELATRIQNQATASTGAAGPAGPQGIPGPLSSLSCADGEAAIASAGSWVCGSGSSTSAEFSNKISVDINLLFDSSWQSWAGGGISATVTEPNSNNTADSFAVTGLNVDEVTLRGTLISNLNPTPITRNNFIVSGLNLGTWSDEISKANLGKITAPVGESSMQRGSYTTYAPYGYATLSTIVLTSLNTSGNNSAYTWWYAFINGQDVRRNMSVKLYEAGDAKAVDSNDLYATYNFIECVPVGWKSQGSSETLTLQCRWLDTQFGNNPPEIRYFNSAKYDINTIDRDAGLEIIVQQGSRRYQYNPSFPTSYTLPVLDKNSNAAVTKTMTFQASDLVMTGGTATD